MQAKNEYYTEFSAGESTSHIVHVSRPCPHRL